MGKTRKENNKRKESREQDSGQLFNYAQDSYLERTSRPVYAVIFLLPLIIFYEWGTFRFNTDILNHSQERILAFVWLQNLLEPLGYGGKFAWVAPPLAVVAILLAQQITSGKKWYFLAGDVLPMTTECVLLAVPLIVLTLFLNRQAAPQADVGRPSNTNVSSRSTDPPDYLAAANSGPPSPANESSADPSTRPLIASIVTGIGAGIYEELVFRLILICLLMLLFQDVLRLPHKDSLVLAVLISAAFFSAHHHIDLLSGRPNEADPFNMTKFVFRTMAGVYFAVLFAIRGFGIAAGTHAAYDILAVCYDLLTTRFFQQ